MRRSFIAVVTAAATLAISTGSALAGPNPFVGAWEGIDLDGSHMDLTVSGQTTQVHLVLHDDHASFCIRSGAPQGEATLRATGTVVGNSLTFQWTEIRCPGGIVVPLSDPPNTMTYDPALNIIQWTQGEGLPPTVWYRHGSRVV